MKVALIGALLLVPLSTGAARSTDVVGVVMRGPTSPICAAGTPCESPAAGVTVKAFRAAKLVASTTTSRKGRFRFSLASGYYSFVADGRGAEPRTVHVTPAAPVHLSFLIDTGIR